MLLYQLLSGQHPTAPPGATPADLMRATLDTDPGPLSDAATSSHGASTPSATLLRAASGLARAQLQAGDLPAARAQADRAVTAARAKLGRFQSSLFLGEALLVLGEVATAQDDRVAARSALEEAVRPLGDAVGDRAPLDIEATRALAALGRP